MKLQWMIIIIILISLYAGSSNAGEGSFKPYRIYFFTTSGGNIQAEPRSESKTIGKFKKGEIFLYEFEGGEFGKLLDAESLKIIGYVQLPLKGNLEYANDLDSAKRIFKKQDEQKRVREEQERVKKEQERVKKSEDEKHQRDKEAKLSSYPPDVRECIKKKEIMLRMTAEQVIMSWGKPDRINQSVGAWGVNEQWVYGDTYLYFENDILTSYQTSK